MVTVCETNDIKTHSDESGRNVESDAPGVVELLSMLLEGDGEPLDKKHK
jgi:hypothetical protein